MGVNFTKLLKKSTKSIKKHPYLAILGLGFGLLGSGYLLMRKPGSIFDITLSYDEDDDLDEVTIIAILDATFTMGPRINLLKKEFNEKRRAILSSMSNISGNAGSSASTVTQSERTGEIIFDKESLRAYVQCVLDYEERIGKEMEKNQDQICEELGVSREDIRTSQNKYITSLNSPRLLGSEEALMAKIPRNLSTQRAKKIKEDMQNYAIECFHNFLNYFQSVDPN